MLELGLIVAALAAAATVLGWLRRPHAAEAPLEDDLVDLPCPWCLAPTVEEDDACPACHEPFGVARSA
jgi:hypothetical protein